MYSITYNSINNMISVAFDSLPYGEELERYSNELLSAVDSSPKGFTLLFDMTNSKAKVIGDSDIAGLKQAKQYCLEKGMKKCAFVMKSITVKLQISRFLKDTQPQDGFFEEVDDAITFLNN